MSTNANAREPLAHELIELQLWLRAIAAVQEAIPLLDVPDGVRGPTKEELAVAEALALIGLLAEKALEELNGVSAVIQRMRGALSDSANASRAAGMPLGAKLTPG